MLQHTQCEEGVDLQPHIWEMTFPGAGGSQGSVKVTLCACRDCWAVCSSRDPNQWVWAPGSQVAPLGRAVAHPDGAGCSQIPTEMLTSTLTHIHGILLLGWRLSKNSLALLQRECQQPLNSTHFLSIKPRSSSIAISGSSRELRGGWDLPPSIAWW